jgi:hypothetical protein
VIWAIAAAILVPWTLYDLYRINHDSWTDSIIEPHQPFNDE